ncbi:Phosphoribosylglycinamide formyltransferase [Richelia intracellularis HH01]|jgi:phosphoribosylglycinamide formyltransferase-1|uniref:Phosphoribosylglycinamide formyltransferase n=1 Tax=Richelia intracellularis HH01 TaxID=1165094 RepID=M1X245_9NOST|nr:phosphoribosylglycinamide formyltransferase [Richelia intracellularis]CCH66185.1 Phosphoribosylglycinamide formyltransferase [Richelia intracellularis HH01]
MTIYINSTPNLISPNINIQQKKPIFLKLGIMASGNGSNFEAIACAIAEQKLNAQIQVLIYNNPNAYAAIRADAWNVPSVLLNHRKYTQREILDEKIVETLQNYDVNLVVMAGWMRLATPVLINAFTNRIVNIHPSLLPVFKGINAIEQALGAGVKIAGCTAHLVCLEMDSGPILIQAAVPVLPEDTSATLHARIQIEEHKILPMAIELLAMQ